LSRAEILLAPAALGLAYLVGIGVESIGVDLPELGFGVRQPISFALLAVGVLGLLSPFAAVPGGRFGQPDVDWGQALSWQADEAAVSGAFATMFIGRDVPGTSHALRGGARFALAGAGGPSLETSQLPPPTQGLRRLEDVAQVIVDKAAPNAGALLAPYGIRYVAVPAGDSRTRNALAATLDLVPLQDDPAGTVFENKSWRPTVTGLVEAVPGRSLPLAVLSTAEVPDRFGNWKQTGRYEWEGPTGAAVYAGLPFDRRVRLRADARSTAPKQALGWATQWESTPPGRGLIILDAGPWRPLSIAFIAIVWAGAVVTVLSMRGRDDADEPA
jgi:hypothetical protein